MKIRNRIVDIKVLQTNILQDYFRISLFAHNMNDDWKPTFFDEVKKGLNSQYSSSYYGAWEKFQLRGIDEYSIDDMDTTILITILKGHKNSNFECFKFKKMYQCLENLQDDRNIDAHMTANETESELIQWAFGSLHNINKFVIAVAKAKESTIPEDERRSFARTYQGRIDSLRILINDEYRESLQENETTRTINNDIIRIKTSKDPFRTYVEIQGQYVKQKDAEGKPDLKLHRLFMYAAATDGLIWPCPLIGDYHFEGILTNVDYLKAAEYYEKGFSILGPDQKIRLASLYINNLAGSSHTKEEGVEILKSCEDPKWEIITYKAHEGYEFYARKKKSPNS